MRRLCTSSSNHPKAKMATTKSKLPHMESTIARGCLHLSARHYLNCQYGVPSAR